MALVAALLVEQGIEDGRAREKAEAPAADYNKKDDGQCKAEVHDGHRWSTSGNSGSGTFRRASRFCNSQFAKEKHLFIRGDCREYFPTADNIRQAAKLAKSVT